MVLHKPFIQAAENNKAAIAEALRSRLQPGWKLLEVGAGTGQHAVHMARTMPQVHWQASDREDAVAGINLWIREAALVNLPPAIVLDVDDETWAGAPYNAMFSANTVHYMPWASVQRLFLGVSNHLASTGRFFLYGPFNYDGRYVSDGNRRLDLWLRQQDKRFAIRDIEALISCAQDNGLRLSEDLAMPSNNRVLVWEHENVSNA